MGFRDVIKSSLPSAVAKQLEIYRNAQREQAGEKSADWYDKAFEESDTYDKHYTESRYYPIWTVLIDRVRRRGSAKVLEMGCGTGQLAWALRDYGLLKDYCGFDFSPKRIEFARNQCTNLRFEIADAFQTDLFETTDYDMVITTEFLEHVEGDLEAIDRIKPGVHFLGTVPNYPWHSHVRHFEASEQVMERYSGRLVDFSVVPIIRRKDNKIIYVMEGRKA